MKYFDNNALPHDDNNIAVFGGIDSSDPTKTLPFEIDPITGRLLVSTDGSAPGGGGTEYADGAARGTATGVLALGDDGTNVQSIKVDSSGRQEVTVNGTVAVSGSFYPATQPVSGTVSVNALPAGTNNIGDIDVLTLPVDTYSAVAVDATASGDNTIVAITNVPRLHYICLSANGANSADVTAIVKVGTSAKFKVSLKAGSIWARNIGAGRRYLTGSTGDDIIVNLSAAQTVHVSAEYEDI